MKATKNNFQFQHDFSKESYELIKILFPKALEKGFAYGMIDGKKFMNTHAFHPHVPIVTPSEAIALLQPTSSEKWEPEWGKEYEFSQDGEKWERGLFIAMNPRYKDDYLYMSKTTDFILGGKYIRPVKTLRDEIVSEIFDWVYKNEKPLDLADRILALIEQRRGGRDDY